MYTAIVKLSSYKLQTLILALAVDFGCNKSEAIERSLKRNRHSQTHFNNSSSSNKTYDHDSALILL